MDRPPERPEHELSRCEAVRSFVALRLAVVSVPVWVGALLPGLLPRALELGVFFVWIVLAVVWLFALAGVRHWRARAQASRRAGDPEA
jgi:hypothetical protein